MTLSKHFITASRKDLVGMTRILMGAIDPSLLRHRHLPVTVSVLGAMGSGKKIVPDESVRFFFNEHAVMAGKKEYDEMHHGQNKSHAMDIGFLNIAAKLYSPRIKDKNQFLQTNPHADIAAQEADRKAGGLAFFHNDQLGILEPDVEIYIDRVEAFEFLIDHEHEDRMRRDFGVIAALAETKEKNDETALRYIEISVLSDRLLACTSFVKAVEMLQGSQKSIVPGIPAYAFAHPECEGWK